MACTWESFKGDAQTIVEKLKGIIHEGNVRPSKTSRRAPPPGSSMFALFVLPGRYLVRNDRVRRFSAGCEKSPNLTSRSRTLLAQNRGP